MKQSNLKIAVTGGIGSGKSCVLKIIAEEGFATLSCDEEYAELLRDKNFCKYISENMGGGYLTGGTLNKEKLKKEVFLCPEKLKELNGLTHPKIMQRLLQKAESESIAFCEVPLLFENGFEKLFDGVIVVMREKSQRISAVVKRDNISEKDVLLRINSQFDYDNCDFAKYYVIHNDSNLEDLRQKTLEILQKISAIRL